MPLGRQCSMTKTQKVIKIRTNVFCTKCKKPHIRSKWLLDHSAKTDAWFCLNSYKKMRNTKKAVGADTGRRSAGEAAAAPVRNRKRSISDTAVGRQAPGGRSPPRQRRRRSQPVVVVGTVVGP